MILVVKVDDRRRRISEPTKAQGLQELIGCNVMNSDKGLLLLVKREECCPFGGLVDILDNLRSRDTVPVETSYLVSLFGVEVSDG